MLLYVPINRLLTGGITTETFIDQYIPLIPIFIIPYILAWPYWGFSIVIFLRSFDKKLLWHMAIAFILAGVISAIIYVIWPTYVIRPEVTAIDTFSNMVRDLYATDAPYNALPSGHTFYTLLCFFFYLKLVRNKTLKILIGIFSFLIIASTLFTKQHYFLDPIGGAIFAVLIYLISGLISKRFIRS